MKFKHLIFGFATAAVMVSCKEKPIVIPELQVGDRKILVEELTGVTCQNCPAGAEDLRVLGQSLGENLIVVSLHAAAGYDVPFGNSKYDFRSEDCRAVADYLYVNGDPGAPAASIDRNAVTEDVGGGVFYTSIFINRPWIGTINARASDAPELGLFLSSAYNETTRNLDITVNVSPDMPQTGEVRLSVYITEDSIVDLQQKGTQLITDYVHRHVFRDAVSAPTGDAITADLGLGLPFNRTYSVRLSDDWVAKNCHVVAFVHKHGDSNNKQVLQADEVHIIE
jgi:Outer membrane protein Omp28